MVQGGVGMPVIMAVPMVMRMRVIMFVPVRVIMAVITFGSGTGVGTGFLGSIGAHRRFTRSQGVP